MANARLTMRNVRSSNARNLAPVTPALVRNMIKSTLVNNQELKRFTIVSLGNAATTAGTVSTISQGIIQGDTVSTRDGNQAVLKRIVFRYNQISALASTTTSLRFILFSDSQANGVVPTVADVLDSPFVVSAYAPSQFMSNRFKIIKDVVHSTTLTAATYSINHVFDMKMHTKLTFLGPTSVAASNGKNAVYLLVIGDNTGATYGVGFDLHFTDS